MEKGSNKHLRWSVLKKYRLSLKPDGDVYKDGYRMKPDREIILCYRDEGPDAWANSEYFDGPIWYWDETDGWIYFKDELKIYGYHGLNATLVTIKDDVVHVTKVTADEY